MTYTATYATSDLSAMVTDVIGGFFDAIATMANPVAIAIMGLIALGLVFELIAKLKRWGQ